MKSVLFSAAAAAALAFAGVAMAQVNVPSTGQVTGNVTTQTQTTVGNTTNETQGAVAAETTRDAEAQVNGEAQAVTNAPDAVTPPANVQAQTTTEGDGSGDVASNATVQTPPASASATASNEGSSASSGMQVAANAPDSAMPRRNSSEWLNQREAARLRGEAQTSSQPG